MWPRLASVLILTSIPSDMAKDKKSIVVYADWISIFEHLTDEEAGRIIKHFFRYVNDQDPTPPDRLTKLLFEPIKQQLKRDLRKYETMCIRNRSNGGKGGRPPTNPQKPTGLNKNPKNPDEPDNDNDNDIDKTNNTVSLYPMELLTEVELLFDEKVRPKTKKQRTDWAGLLDKLIRIDGHPPEEILRVINWARDDPFWSQNFISLLKLRLKNKEGIKYYDVFKIKADGQNRQGNQRTQGVTGEQLAGLISSKFATNRDQ
jgi:hypothetical protein